MVTVNHKNHTWVNCGVMLLITVERWFPFTRDKSFIVCPLHYKIICTRIFLLLMPSVTISNFFQILRQRFGVKCFLGLTATATKETVLNIAKHLNLSDSEEDCVKGTILPPNLNLSVSKDCFKEQVGTLTGLSARYQKGQAIWVLDSVWTVYFLIPCQYWLSHLYFCLQDVGMNFIGVWWIRYHLTVVSHTNSLL